MGGELIEKTWRWRLQASPDALWPILSDVARLNEALDLPPYRLSETIDGRGLRRRHGEAFEEGVRVRWEEPPFDWVAGQWWRWRRYHEGGPLSVTGATLLLRPVAGGGTELSYTLEAEPSGAVGRILLASGHLRAAAKALEKIARAADAHCQEPVGDFFANFAARRRPFRSLSAPRASGPRASDEDRDMARRLFAWLAVAPEADVTPIRPRALAVALDVAPEEAVGACLRAVEGGSLRFVALAVCPVCRRPAQQEPALFSLPAEIGCPSCGAMFARDFAACVEAGFLCDASLRPLARGVHCASGPQTAPHAAIQQTLDARERREFPTALAAEAYVARAVDIGASAPFQAQKGAGALVRLGPEGVAIHPLEGGVVFENHTELPATILLERAARRADALAAADLIAMQAYRDAPPPEPAEAVDQAPAGEGGVLALEAAEGLEPDALAAAAARFGGAVYAQAENRAFLVFREPADAIAAADALMAAAPDARAGLDLGPLAATLDHGVSGYAGPAQEGAAALCATARPGETLVSERLMARANSAGVSAPPHPRVHAWAG